MLATRKIDNAKAGGAGGRDAHDRECASADGQRPAEDPFIAIEGATPEPFTDDRNRCRLVRADPVEQTSPDRLRAEGPEEVARHEGDRNGCWP